MAALAQALLPELVKTLGKSPAKVPLNPQILSEWEEDGLVKQKIVFDVEAELSATAYVFRPAAARGKSPAILACHGHGNFGKDSVMGIRSAQAVAENAPERDDYGLQMAKAGFVTIAIDWRGFGERDDRGEPFLWKKAGSRDLCNLHFLRAVIIGQTVLGMNIHDGRCCAGLFVPAGFRRSGSHRRDGIVVWRNDGDMAGDR